MAKKRIVIVGAGGFAREVNWLIKDINAFSPSFDCLGYIVSDLGKIGEHDSSERLLGDFSWLDANRTQVDCLAMGIGNPASKLNIAKQLAALVPNIEWPSLVHPRSMMDRESCCIKEGVVICAGVIATVGVTFLEFAMVNLSCTIGHEAQIGRGCVLNPSVNISGGVRLGDGVLVGTGAQILQYLKVGNGATIGAGSVVTRVVEDGQLVVGIPAKPIMKTS